MRRTSIVIAIALAVAMMLLPATTAGTAPPTGSPTGGAVDRGALDTNVIVWPGAFHPTVRVGSDERYAATVANDGAGSADDVVVTIGVPSGLTFLGAAAEGGSCTATRPITCTLGSIDAGSSKQVTVRVAHVVAGRRSLRMTMSTSSTQTQTSDDSASWPIRMVGRSCTRIGTMGRDVMTGTGAGEVLCGLGGADRLRGAGGADTVYGGSGADTIAGDAGGDRLDGGAGIDTATWASSGRGVVVDLPARTARGQGTDVVEGVERVVGTSRADTLVGDARANRLTGGVGPDTIAGRGGADQLLGGAGDDAMRGGAADDYYVGGRGVDVCFADGGTDVKRGCEGPVFVPQWDGVVYKPRRIFFGNRPPTTGITWTSYDTASAYGRATYLENDCSPSCAEGSISSHPARITLRGRIACEGVTAYRYMTVRRTDGQPTGMTNLDLSWDCEW